MHFCMQNIALETFQPMVNQFQGAHFHNNSQAINAIVALMFVNTMRVFYRKMRGSDLLAIMKYAFLHAKYCT